jgi:hypothetical protein
MPIKRRKGRPTVKIPVDFQCPATIHGSAADACSVIPVGQIAERYKSSHNDL